MFKDLNDFIAALEKERELARIADEVSPDLEICAVTDRVSKSPGGGPGLLFERPTGYGMPVAVNLFGSMKRMCMALGVGKLDDLAAAIRQFRTHLTRIQSLKEMREVGRRLAEAQEKAGVDVPVSEAYRSLNERSRLVYELSGGTPQSLDHGTSDPQGAQTNE